MAKQQVKTESIAKLSIAAINKAEGLLNLVPKVLAEFSNIKDEVETIKADLNLGLAQYEVEIQEKKSLLDEQLTSKQEEVAIQLKLRQEALISKYAELAKEVEEKTYQHKIAIDREDVNTARTIADKKGLALFDKDIVVKHEIEIEKLTIDLDLKAKIAISSAVKNAKEELNETIRGKDTQITILENNLSNANDKVITLNNEITYLKEQLNASRQQTVDALAAAKVSVQQTNTGK